jgi:hypothetical protein
MTMKISWPDVVRLLGHVWASPVTVPCFLCYVLPCWLLGWYDYYRNVDDACVWVVSHPPQWLARLWVPWNGQTMGTCVVLRETPEANPELAVTLIHELEHVRQGMRWGIMQPIAYALSSITAMMAGEDHYKLNVFEIAARKKAGQDPLDR